MTEKTISEDFADNPVTWSGDEIIPVVKTLGSPPSPENAAGLASTLLAWLKSMTGLSELKDVDIAGSPGPADGDTLTYDAVTQKWVASAPTTGSSTLAALTDTDVAGSPSPVDGQTLTYNASLGKWIASSAVAAAAQTQTGEMISGYIGTVANKTYKLVVKAAHAGAITEATAISESGTCTATFKINTTALGGTANSVSSSETSESHSSANAFSAGDDIQLTVSSNSTCLGLSFTLKYTRVYA